ncbi:hypothetical protein FB451DRAFT_771243 [Mycena latifolia]|nr:hypothetical protein FB451DRAFT_771243 [Mycena latifolia]
MESEIPRSQTPHPLPLHSNGSEDDTRVALRELQLAAVERDAQVAWLEVHLKRALEDIERARAETKAVEMELAAVRAKYERAKEWWVRNMDRKRKNDSQEGDGGASRSPDQAWAGALPDPHCSRSAVVLTAPLQSQSRAHAQDRDPRKCSASSSIRRLRPYRGPPAVRRPARVRLGRRLCPRWSALST